jgi:hypothetical protein
LSGWGIGETVEGFFSLSQSISNIGDKDTFVKNNGEKIILNKFK